jgi:hypothetical protein
MGKKRDQKQGGQGRGTVILTWDFCGQLGQPMVLGVGEEAREVKSHATLSALVTWGVNSHSWTEKRREKKEQVWERSDVLSDKLSMRCLSYTQGLCPGVCNSDCELWAA